MYCSLIGNFQFKAKHIYSKNNMIADSLSRANFQKFRQQAPMNSTDSCGILKPFEDEVKSLLKTSVSKSTCNVYENAIQSFERFRNQFGIENIWSPPTDHLINHIACLSKTKKGYSSATATSYISGISYKLKINNLEGRTQSFI